MLPVLTIVVSLNFCAINEVTEIKTHLLEILNYYEPYELTSIKNDVNAVLILIDSYENNNDTSTLNQIKQQYELIRYAHYHVVDMSYEQTELKNKYFKTWERISYLKKRVDNLFIYELKGGSLALDINEADKKVRKKSIYQAYTTVYEQYIRKLKGINECDYQAKIALLVKIDPVLVISEQLLLQEDTKLIEKELRSIENAADYEKALLSYP